MYRLVINWLFFFLTFLTRELLEDRDYISFIFVSSVPNTGSGSSYLLNEFRKKEGREGGGKTCPPATIKHYRKTNEKMNVSCHKLLKIHLVMGLNIGEHRNGFSVI